MASSFELDSSDTDKAPKTGAKAKPAPRPSGTAAPKKCEFPGCENTVQKPKTGRPPKFCPEHNGGKPSPGANRSELTGKSWPEAAFVEASLNKMFALAGMGVAIANAKDGQIIAKGGPDVSKALVQLAIDDTSLRKYLMYLTTPGKYGPLIMACMGIALPIAQNHGLLTFNVNLSDQAKVFDAGKVV